jgi:hypothetical protein
MIAIGQMLLLILSIRLCIEHTQARRLECSNMCKEQNGNMNITHKLNIVNMPRITKSPETQNPLHESEFRAKQEASE